MLIAAHSQFSSIFEQDDVIPMKPRMNFLHVMQVYYGATMNPNEFLRIEALLQRGKRLSNDILTGGHVQDRAIPGRFDPFNINGFYENDSPVLIDG